MIPFYLTFIAVLLCGLAARDQVYVASLTSAHGKRWSVLAIGAVVSIGTAIFAGWAATMIAPLMAPAARVFLCAMAIALAGGESLVVVPKGSSREPHRSLLVTTATLLFHQLTDAARFIVFGIAVATNAPVVVAAGGAFGGIALLAIAWARPDLVLDARTRIARRLLGVGFILIGAYVAMRALDWD